jgi:hypothetical protein
MSKKLTISLGISLGISAKAKSSLDLTLAGVHKNLRVNWLISFGAVENGPCLVLSEFLHWIPCESNDFSKQILSEFNKQWEKGLTWYTKNTTCRANASDCRLST